LRSLAAQKLGIFGSKNGEDYEVFIGQKKTVANANNTGEIFADYFSVSFTYKGWSFGWRLEIKRSTGQEKKNEKAKGRWHSVAALRVVFRERARVNCC
jgi:hypothetical protein